VLNWDLSAGLNKLPKSAVLGICIMFFLRKPIQYRKIIKVKRSQKERLAEKVWRPWM